MNSLHAGVSIISILSIFRSIFPNIKKRYIYISIKMYQPYICHQNRLLWRWRHRRFSQKFSLYTKSFTWYFGLPGTYRITYGAKGVLKAMYPNYMEGSNTWKHQYIQIIVECRLFLYSENMVLSINTYLLNLNFLKFHENTFVQGFPPQSNFSFFFSSF